MLLQKKPKTPQDWREMHLCYLADLGYRLQNTRKYKTLVRKPKSVCKNCGRVAEDRQNLCVPAEI